MKESFYREHRKLLKETIDLAIVQDESLKAKARKLIDSIPISILSFHTKWRNFAGLESQSNRISMGLSDWDDSRMSTVGDLSRPWGVFLRDHKVTSHIESMPTEKVAIYK